MVKLEFNRRDIRSFVIRGGRITEAQEKGLEQYWPEYGLSLHDGLLSFEQCFGNANPVVLEIGYGMGDSLLVMAAQEPDKNFIGIEVHLPGVGRLVNEAAKLELNNLKTYCADAIDVLTDCIPPKSLERVQLYFPDPWHKKKHHKRRIVQAEFVDLIASRLKSQGIFHLATDWVPYAEHMLEVLQKTTNLRNLSSLAAYCDRPTWRPETKFERRGERLGHDVRDLLFEKNHLNNNEEKIDKK